MNIPSGIFFVVVLSFVRDALAAPTDKAARLREIRQATNAAFRFNEMALDEDAFFFEFVSTTGTTARSVGVPRMAGHFLLILEDNPLRTVLAADLASPCMAFDDQQFLVFGSTKIRSFRSNVDCDSVTINNEDHTFVFEDSVTYMAILLHSNTRDLQPLLPRSKAGSDDDVVYSDIRHTWKAVLRGKNVLADVAILCQKSQCTEMTAEGTEFMNELSRSARAVLPTDPVKIDFGASLNYCDQSNPFMYNLLKTGYPTPGRANDCSENFLQGVPPETCSLDAVQSSATCEDNVFETNFQKESSLTAGQMGTPAIDESSAKFVKMWDTLRNWEPVEPRNLQFGQCRHLFSHKGKILNDNTVPFWLHLTRVRESVQCIMKCDACNKIFALGLRPDIRHVYRQEITSDVGKFTKTAPHKNTETLKIHMNSQFHKNAVLFSQKVHNSKDLEEKKSALLQYMVAQEKLYLPTKAYLVFVYAQATSGIPFLVHEKLVKALEVNGWGFGGTQSSRFAAVTAITLMSQYIRNQFIERFVSEKSRFSIIIDASTDSASIPYIVVLIQSVVDSKIQIRLYGMLRVKRENSAEMFAAILSQIQKDEVQFPGIEARFKTSLTAVASDNARGMVSQGTSMYARFRQYTGRNIIQQGCANHNLELAFEKALKPDESYLSNFNTTYWKQFLSFYEKHNEFYNFYASRGNRRWQHFQEVCEQRKVKCKRFKQYLNVRWAESHYRVLEAISINTNAIIVDLNHWMTVETAGNNEKFGTALYNTVTNLLYGLVLRDQMDYLEIFRFISLRLQRRNLLVDSYKLIERGVDDLVNLKLTIGPHLKKFIDTCSCARKCVAGQCNLSELETCRRDVHCSNEKYTKNSLKLHQFREELIEQIYGSLYDYFDIYALRGLKLFDFKEHVYNSRNGRYIPDPDEEIHFTRLCSLLKIKDTECVNLYYKNLIEFLHQYGRQIQDQQHENVSDYLLKLLTNNIFNLNHNVRNLIEMITVLPAGSAEAERSFSFLNLYKTKRRFKLTSDNVQDLVNLRINGPPISEFDGNSVVEYYVERHFRTDAIRDKNLNPESRKEQMTELPVTGDSADDFDESDDYPDNDGESE